jgi:hypothetical protein
LKTINNTDKTSVRKQANKQHTVSSKQNEQTNSKPATMTTTEEEIDLTDITHNDCPPTLISITKARREISRQLIANKSMGQSSHS